jgi:uncharacterized protein (TIGR00255 family)
MIQSMTAFARGQAQGDWGSLTCELRSINHRYLELSVRMPDTLQSTEMAVRERVRQVIKRGKVECFFRYQPKDTVSQFVVDDALVDQLCVKAQQVAKQLDNAAAINPLEVLKWPGVLQVTEMNNELVQTQLVALLDTVLVDLISARQREGDQLKKLCLQRLENMSVQLDHVRQRLPIILVLQRQKILARFHDAQLSLDPERVEQELVMVAHKIDISEELERLDTHLIEVKRCLEKDDAMGRRLDFLMQELNREANTLGSKSVDAETTLASVELKVLIEQLREQVQNIE